jgi:hypothetical protein
MTYITRLLKSFSFLIVAFCLVHANQAHSATVPVDEDTIFTNNQIITRVTDFLTETLFYINFPNVNKLHWHLIRGSGQLPPPLSKIGYRIFSLLESSPQGTILLELPPLLDEFFATYSNNLAAEIRAKILLLGQDYTAQLVSLIPKVNPSGNRNKLPPKEVDKARVDATSIANAVAGNYTDIF